MFSRYFLFYLAVFLEAYLCLKSTNFCKLIEKECKGSYDGKLNYKVVCDAGKCIEKYPYKCEKNICTVDKQECEDYLDFSYFTNVIAKKDKLKSVFLKQDYYEDKFNQFKIKIQNCTEKAYQFKPSDMCLKGVSCYQRQEILSRLNSFGFGANRKFALKKIECPCRGDYSYHCGKQYCTVNRLVCDSFTAKNIKLKSNEIKNCTGNAIILLVL